MSALQRTKLPFWTLRELEGAHAGAPVQIKFFGFFMKYNPDIHHRRSIRLKNYDYSQAGLYFVTICVNNRLSLFGQIVNGEMLLNDAGKMIEKWWFEMACKFGQLALHEFVVMPNHFHGIIEIVGADLRVCPAMNETPIVEVEVVRMEGAHAGAPLHEIVQWFKTMTTNEYIRNVRQNHWQPFENKLWQRNYHEHIIRNETAYVKIAEYVQTNPQKWHDDCYF